MIFSKLKICNVDEIGKPNLEVSTSSKPKLVRHWIFFSARAVAGGLSSKSAVVYKWMEDYKVTTMTVDQD